MEPSTFPLYQYIQLTYLYQQESRVTRERGRKKRNTKRQIVPMDSQACVSLLTCTCLCAWPGRQHATINNGTLTPNAHRILRMCSSTSGKAISSQDKAFRTETLSRAVLKWLGIIVTCTRARADLRRRSLASQIPGSAHQVIVSSSLIIKSLYFFLRSAMLA